MAFRHLIEHGINPFKETNLIEGRTHDNVVLAVQSGMVDVGTIRNNILERMQTAGTIKIDDFHIIDRVSDDFPFIHSTRLYPEMPMVALAHVPESIVTKVKNALLNLKPDLPELQDSKMGGYVEPLDYTPVAKTLIINILNGLE